MGTPQWPKGIGMLNIKAMESARPPPPPLPPTTNNKGRAQKEQCLNCPRCNSTNTKFCYYNNYSLTQPRHYCKTCRRYWTRGGCLRNVPIGGTSRKNKRPAPTPPPPSASISPSPSSSNKKLFTGHRNPNLTTTVTSIHAAQDLNLAYPSTENYNDAAINSRTTGLIAPCTQNFDTATINPRTSVFAPSAQNYSIATLSHGYHHNTNPTIPTGFASMGLNSFLPVLNSGAGIYSSGFGGFHEYKPHNFSLDGFDGSSGHGTQPQENGTTGASCKPLFPFEDLKQQVSSTAYGGDSNAVGYWNNMLGGGPW